LHLDPLQQWLVT